MFNRSTGITATLCILAFLGPSQARGQSLADAAAKERERRRKAAETATYADQGKPGDAGTAPAASSASMRASETHTESWWRSHARTCREAVADAEEQVKYYGARIEEARTGVRQPQPGDALQQTPPTRIATD